MGQHQITDRLNYVSVEKRSIWYGVVEIRPSCAKKLELFTIKSHSEKTNTLTSK